MRIVPLWRDELRGRAAGSERSRDPAEDPEDRGSDRKVHGVLAAQLAPGDGRHQLSDSEGAKTMKPSCLLGN